MLVSKEDGAGHQNGTHGFTIDEQFSIRAISRIASAWCKVIGEKLAIEKRMSKPKKQGGIDSHLMI
jgi:hypothetical protein